MNCHKIGNEPSKPSFTKGPCDHVHHVQEENRSGRRQPEKQGSAIDLDIGPPLEPSQVQNSYSKHETTWLSTFHHRPGHRTTTTEPSQVQDSYCKHETTWLSTFHHRPGHTVGPPLEPSQVQDSYSKHVTTWLSTFHHRPGPGHKTTARA